MEIVRNSPTIVEGRHQVVIMIDEATTGNTNKIPLVFLEPKALWSLHYIVDDDDDVRGKLSIVTLFWSKIAILNSLKVSSD